MVELLAPAGDIECFNAALKGGADAIYMAGQAFGARASAKNFSTEEFIECLNKAHISGRKIYLTLNTLIKEREWKELYSFLNPLYQSGLDGVIIQDLGLIPYLSECFPLLPLHASTQMTVTDSLSARMLRSMGVVRIVPARELCLKEIKALKEESGLEIETFIHGALCYCYSGQCLFSSYLGGRSGNRGRCAGPCRLPYSVISADNGRTLCNNKYPLSLKDLCVIEHVGDLIEAGIDSFKIEGRLKSPEYVAGVTYIYRKYIDRYLSGSDMSVDRLDMKRLSELYLRSSVGSGYYYNHNGRDMLSINDPSYNNKSEDTVNWVKSSILEQERLIPVDMSATLHLGEAMTLRVSSQNCEYTAYGDVIEAAGKRAATVEDVNKQLSKLGGSGFDLESLNIDLDDGIFLPVSRLNELRRQAIDGLRNEIVRAYLRPEGSRFFTGDSTHNKETVSDDNVHISCLVNTSAQLMAAVKKNLKRIYIPYDLIYKRAVSLEKVRRSTDSEIYLVLPRIIRLEDRDYLKELSLFIESNDTDGIMVRNLEGLQFLRDIDYKQIVEADYTLYGWNRTSMGVLKKYVKRVTAPLELSYHELADIGYEGDSVVVYGHAPLMVSAGCVRKNLDHCQKHDEQMEDYYLLRDRYNKEHIDVCNCIHCYNEIYNAVPTSFHKYLDRLPDIGLTNYRIDLTVEEEAETTAILDYYLNPEGYEVPFTEYTSGHIVKGAI